MIIQNKKIAVIGLSYGDEGKGTIVDYLTDYYQIDRNIRFNGGAQAAHHVVNEAGAVHCFAQFGSGTLQLNHQVKTILMKQVLIEPLAILNEGNALITMGVSNPFENCYIHQLCRIITPFHSIITKMKEIARDNRHGSCGMGVGELFQDILHKKSVLTINDLFNKERLTLKLKNIQANKINLAKKIIASVSQNDKIEMLNTYMNALSQPNMIASLIEQYQLFIDKNIHFIDDAIMQQLESSAAIFEGAQGALLDKDYGFWPYVTPSNVTLKNINQTFSDVHNLGVLRAYNSRHGNGPFPTEDYHLGKLIPDWHNGLSAWQGAMRIGWFDAVMSRYAINIAGNIDSIAITGLDRLQTIDSVKIATHYSYQGDRQLFAKYFEIDENNLITNIKYHTHIPSHAYQSQLTALINRCEPIYMTFRDWNTKNEWQQNSAHYLHMIEKLLNKPISIISSGATKKDKQHLRMVDVLGYQLKPIQLNFQ